MNPNMIKYIFGSVIALSAAGISYFVVGTNIGHTIAAAVNQYCTNPQSERLKLRIAVNQILEGNAIEIHCLGDTE